MADRNFTFHLFCPYFMIQMGLYSNFQIQKENNLKKIVFLKTYSINLRTLTL